MVVVSGSEATEGNFSLVADSPKLQLGDYLAQGSHHSRAKFTGLDVFAEFGHGGSAVRGVTLGAL